MHGIDWFKVFVSVSAVLFTALVWTGVLILATGKAPVAVRDLNGEVRTLNHEEAHAHAEVRRDGRN